MQNKVLGNLGAPLIIYKGRMIGNLGAPLKIIKNSLYGNLGIPLDYDIQKIEKNIINRIRKIYGETK